MDWIVNFALPDDLGLTYHDAAASLLYAGAQEFAL